MSRPNPNFYFKDAVGLRSLYIEVVPGKDQELNPAIISKLEKQLDLIFTPGDLESGNVCLANEEEVLPAFRTSFNTADLLAYIRGVQKSHIFIERGGPGEIHLPYPGGPDFFWQQVGLGRRY